MFDIETRPKTLVFVRHGESVANVVQRREKIGDRSGYTDKFKSTANSNMELTENGLQQAKIAGDWIIKNIGRGYFNGYYVSSFRRALQTASQLHLPEAETKGVWKVRDYIREQHYGYFGNLPPDERDQILPQIIGGTRKRDGLHWAPLGGESMADLVFRAKIGIIQTLHRELPNGSGITVTHGNLLWAVRIVMEGLTANDYERLDRADNTLDKMHNCQILE